MTPGAVFLRCLLVLPLCAVEVAACICALEPLLGPDAAAYATLLLVGHCGWLPGINWAVTGHWRLGDAD